MICRYYVWMDEYLSVCYVLLLFVQEGLAPMNYEVKSHLPNDLIPNSDELNQNTDILL